MGRFSNGHACSASGTGNFSGTAAPSGVPDLFSLACEAPGPHPARAGQRGAAITRLLGALFHSLVRLTNRR